MKLVINKFRPSTGFSLNKTRLVILPFLVSVFLSACQVNKHYPNDNVVVSNTVNYGQYYLALKSLPLSEINTEIAQQQLKKSQGSIEAEINLILLHSLPNSPVHNVYTAKSQLNEQLKRNENYQFSPADKAFISLLKDQLNQQLFIFKQASDQTLEQELEQNTQLAEQRVVHKKQLNRIAELEFSVSQLTKQISQLKNIEQTISEHGQ
ncbi:MAG: hypothetical protein MJK12_06845 [Colwellia sp.]|nr:hypothetical protein [Colwellia sp.]